MHPPFSNCTVLVTVTGLDHLGGPYGTPRTTLVPDTNSFLCTASTVDRVT